MRHAIWRWFLSTRVGRRLVDRVVSHFFGNFGN